MGWRLVPTWAPRHAVIRLALTADRQIREVDE